MPALPSGTVSLLFSDIEGSTLLLSRLGTAYADALDGQRRIQRKAWAGYDGIELGTEGDSFYVVFPTAEAAVAAAAKAQRELVEYPWPQGERVRIRMGVHTGSPTPHDGAYVGMDVHRAARVAGAAHGGQIVVSEATAHLVGRSLPEGVELRDLGAHQLKDMPAAEHLFQVQGEGLEAQFPPLKTLGTASSLPVPTTPLVGREGEMAELTAVLGSPGVRLVTLTGLGGSGKTRLAISAAQQLTEVFPDGVYFVPLAAVTTGEVMWTTIAETLDVPPEGRIPPGFFTHVAHRSALFVLDNLEQLGEASDVVTELLAEAPHVVVLATSRRPLHVAGEHEHAVPPLELPHDDGLEAVTRAGAVQLFVQRAQMARSTFTLTADNAEVVASICRRLDGLPLAVELAAARTKLLGTRALLARLDKALDIAATGTQVPSRQKTLRDMIAWSYDLLTPIQQSFFARLGVFSGGVDLDAITAVAAEDAGEDTFEVVSDLVDASLVTAGETVDGEPRISMLETVRVYALDQLDSSGELDEMRERHARCYLGVAETLKPLLDSSRHLESRGRMESEHGNFREALRWALNPIETHAVDTDDRVRTGLGLCEALGGFWDASGYFSEGRGWLVQAIERAGGRDGPELARCLQVLADYLRIAGDFDSARPRAAASVDMWRRLGNGGLARALTALATIDLERGDRDRARSLFEEAIAVGRERGDLRHLHVALGDCAFLEAGEGNFDRSLELRSEALAMARELGDPTYLLKHQHNQACLLRQMGRVEEAQVQMRSVVPRALILNEPALLMALPEDYAAILGELGDARPAARLLGAADAMRERLEAPRSPTQEQEIADAIAMAHNALAPEEWQHHYDAGRGTTVEDALADVLAADEPG